MNIVHTLSLFIFVVINFKLKLVSSRLMESDHGILGQFGTTNSLTQGLPQMATLTQVGYEGFNKGSERSGGVQESLKTVG